MGWQIQLDVDVDEPMDALTPEPDNVDSGILVRINQPCVGP